MTLYSWIITKDLIHSPGERSNVGTYGPLDAPLTAQQILEDITARPFKMYDDDGELYYERPNKPLPFPD